MARKSRKHINIIPEAPAGGASQSSVLERKKENALSTAAYIRLSVENNGHDNDDSIQTQIQLVEGFIRQHSDLVLTETYIDNGFSGTNFDRPEFVRMIEAVKSGKIQCVVVKDLSRFGRDYLETGYYIETIFPLLNVRFIAITDQFDSIREEDRNSIAIPIKNMVNAMYAKDYSRKQEVFREMCIRTGRVMGTNAPYGYRFSAESQKLEIDEVVAPYVRMIFAWAMTGVKRLEIAKRLELIGAPTPAMHDNWENSGEHWTDASVKQILYNPAYAGFHVMGKSKISLYKGISAYRTKRSEWVFFPDFHEPYITMEDYEAIEALISRNKTVMDERLSVREEVRKQMPDVFQGMVYCADCGRQMNFGRGSHHRGYDDLSFLYYRCRYSKKFAKCSNKKFQQNFLKIVVMDQIRVLIEAACDKKKVLQMIQQKMAKPGSINHVQRNIIRLSEREQELDDRILRAYVDYADKLLDAEEYQFIKDKLIADKAVISDKKKKLEKKQIEMEQSVRQYQEVTEQLEVNLNETEFNEQLVKELVNKIWVSDDGSVSIEFKCQDVFNNPLITEYITENTEEGV